MFSSIFSRNETQSTNENNSESSNETDYSEIDYSEIDYSEIETTTSIPTRRIIGFDPPFWEQNETTPTPPNSPIESDCLSSNYYFDDLELMIAGLDKFKTKNSSACLIFFGNTNRESNVETILGNFVDAYNESPETALKILYNFRDIRGGKGEKQISRLILFYLKLNKPELYKNIIVDFVNLGIGCWKDLLYLAELGTHYARSTGKKIVPDIELRLFAQQLCIDAIEYMEGNYSNISLCAKWAPSENGHYNNKQLKFAKMITTLLEITPSDYRKTLTTLRTKIKLTETGLSQKRYSQLNFSQIPSRAHKIYRNAFMRAENAAGVYSIYRQYELVNQYKEHLESRNKKVNGTPQPPQEHFLTNNQKSQLISDDFNPMMNDVINKYNVPNTDLFHDLNLNLGFEIEKLNEAIENSKFKKFKKTKKQ